MTEIVLDIIGDALIDGLKLVPFLFLTYFGMEYLEHRTGDRTQELVRKAGKWGPLLGGVVGALPQCGFSAAASNLYAGRVITLGTLFAIYLSTSDEMLPIFISEKAPVGLIAGVLLAKMVLGMLVGFIIDIMFRHQHEEPEHIHDLCEHDHCHCEESILRSAIHHTVQITLFIMLIGIVLNLLFHFVGEDVLADVLRDRPVVGPMVASLVGLIPNCAASVIITQLYLKQVIGVGSMMAGLLTGSGVGLLILFRVNPDKKENMKITGLLYLIGVCLGIMINLVCK
ncbi:MAG: arsenic efflux protein [Lachnospiraceae bacterium]|nr:arsenic efflux protein [Lachnospiraceae bacterium]